MFVQLIRLSFVLICLFGICGCSPIPNEGIKKPISNLPICIQTDASYRSKEWANEPPFTISKYQYLISAGKVRERFAQWKNMSELNRIRTSRQIIDVITRHKNYSRQDKEHLTLLLDSLVVKTSLNQMDQFWVAFKVKNLEAIYKKVEK